MQESVPIIWQADSAFVHLVNLYAHETLTNIYLFKCNAFNACHLVIVSAMHIEKWNTEIVGCCWLFACFLLKIKWPHLWIEFVITAQTTSCRWCYCYRSNCIYFNFLWLLLNQHRVSCASNYRQNFDISKNQRRWNRRRNAITSLSWTQRLIRSLCTIQIWARTPF